MTSFEMFEKENFQEIAVDWEHAHRYSPAPRHRRLIILKLLSSLSFKTCLDAGCAQPYLLQTIAKQFSARTFGADISTKVIEKNRTTFPHAEYQAFDLATTVWPNQQQFDLVISSEVIEHIEDWQQAVKNLCFMSKKYLLITVPSGKLRPIDKKLGHYRHFQGNELIDEINKNAFDIMLFKKHGFPFHSLYKRLINAVAPEKIYDAFSGGKPYSFLQKMISHTLYYLFYFNYCFNHGDQLFVLAKRKEN